MAFSRIALIGASGSLGFAILSAILEHFSASSVTVLTRASSDPSSLPAGVHTTPIKSYSDLSELTTALSNHDILISALPTSIAQSTEPALVKAAVAAKVRRFMPSEYTMDVCDSSYRVAAAENGTSIAIARIEWADELTAMAERGEIEYTTIMPGMFPEYCVGGPKLWGYDLENRKAMLWDGGEHVCTGSTLQFTGRCVAAVLRMPEEETRNKRIRIAECEYSGKACVEALQEVMDEGWTTEEQSLEQMDGRIGEAMQKGDEMQAYLLWVVKWNFSGASLARYDEGLRWNREGEFEVPRMSLKEMMKASVKLNKGKTHKGI